MTDRRKTICRQTHWKHSCHVKPILSDTAEFEWKQGRWPNECGQSMASAFQSIQIHVWLMQKTKTILLLHAVSAARLDSYGCVQEKTSRRGDLWGAGKTEQWWWAVQSCGFVLWHCYGKTLLVISPHHAGLCCHKEGPQWRGLKTASVSDPKFRPFAHTARGPTYRVKAAAPPPHPQDQCCFLVLITAAAIFQSVRSSRQDIFVNLDSGGCRGANMWPERPLN